MEPRIQILRELIEDQIEVVAAAICEGNGALEAELRLEWLTRELVSGQRVFTDQSIAEQALEAAVGLSHASALLSSNRAQTKSLLGRTNAFSRAGESLSEL